MTKDELLYQAAVAIERLLEVTPIHSERCDCELCENRKWAEQILEKIDEHDTHPK